MSIIKNWVGIFGTNIVIVLVGILTGILSARLLTPVGRGELATVLFWPQLIAGIGFLSLREAITYQICKPNHDYASIATIGIVLAIVLAVLSCILSFFTIPILVGTERLDLVIITQKYLLGFVPGNFLSLALLALDHGRQRFWQYNLLRLVPPISYLLGLGILWYLDKINLANVVFANLIGTILAAFLRLSLTWREISFNFKFAELKQLLITGFRFHGLTIVFVLGAQVDQGLGIINLSNTDMGYYIVALTVATSAFGLVANSTYDLLFPAVSKHVRSEDFSEQLSRGLRLTTFALLVLSIILFVIAPWLIPLLFGKEYQGAVVPAQFLLLAYIPISLRQMIIKIMRGLGETSIITIVEALTLLSFTGIGCLFAKTFGLIGLVSAIILTGTLAYGILLHYLRERLGLSYRQMIGLDLFTLKEVVIYGRIILHKRWPVA
jgi:O-antigen/teichoic acid export membrane protein